MKNLKLTTTIVLVVLVAVLFSSCSDNTANHIPKDAFAVMVIDGSEFEKFADPDFVKNNEEYNEAMKQVENESKKAAELIEKMLKNPDASGIMLTEKMYAFATVENKEMVFGCIIPIQRKKLEENIDLIAEEFNVPISMLMETKDDIQYMEPEKGMAFGWNDDVFMFVAAENGEACFDFLSKYMNLDKKESITTDKDFKKFDENCTAFNLWVSSNVVDKIDLEIDAIKQFEDLTGIKLAGNYGHVHLDIQKDEITFISTMKFNESIQNIDKKKLMDNAEKLMELFADPINEGMNLFGGMASQNNDYSNEEWDEEDYGEDYDGDYPEMTEEEWEALLQELEVEMTEEDM
ncbi:MAG: DUF4836 family protein [Bacteroidales bacterium]|nr:DUF4836 family protein [Bacteroidales bacterium]